MNYFSNEKNWKKFKVILDSWVGTPYRHLAEVKGRGADCTMFVASAWKELGLLKDLVYEYYPPDWYLHETEEKVLNGLARHFKEHTVEGIRIIEHDKKDEMFRGDLLTFSTNKRGITNHAGIYLGESQMIHSIENRGVSIFNFDKVWLKRMKVFFRMECN